MIVTTTDIPAGFKVVMTLGIAVGSRPTFGSTYTEGIKNLKGDRTSNWEERYLALRLQAVQRMVDQAVRMGANGVVGVRFDHHEITGMWKELCAYGTAVLLVVDGALETQRNQDATE